MHRPSFRKPAFSAALFVAVSITGLTLTCVRRAWSAVLVPNTTEVTLAAPAGGVSPGFVSFPIRNSPVKIATSCLGGRLGTASIHATLHTAPAPAVTWSGTNAFAGAAVAGITGAVGTPLVGLDLANVVRLRTGPTLNDLQIANGGPAAINVVVEMTW